MKAFLFALFISCLPILGGCGYADHNNPAVYQESSAAAAQEAARLHARDIGGIAEQNQCCGSMEPLIHAGDWVVSKQTHFDDHLLGRVGIYRPKWAGGSRIEHRFVSGNAAEGFIASGDNNARSEPQERVTAANYEGEVIAIYKPAFYPATSTP